MRLYASAVSDRKPGGVASRVKAYRVAAAKRAHDRDALCGRDLGTQIVLRSHSTVIAPGILRRNVELRHGIAERINDDVRQQFFEKIAAG